MTEQEREQIEEQAIREFALEKKRAEDEETIAQYERRLRATKKHYTQMAEAFTTGGRRNRALALGECALQAMDALEKESAKHHFLPGTLSWIIGQDRCVDPDGKKGYKMTVAYHVLADEQSLSDEEIAKEIEETRRKIEAETREMFDLPAEDETPPWEESNS